MGIAVWAGLILVAIVILTIRSSESGRIASVGMMVLLICCAALVYLQMAILPPPPLPPGPPAAVTPPHISNPISQDDVPKYTKANLDRIVPGMPLAQVEAILGPLVGAQKAYDHAASFTFIAWAARPGKVVEKFALDAGNQVAFVPPDSGFYVRFRFADQKLVSAEAFGID
jgi:hypothetical protein